MMQTVSLKLKKDVFDKHHRDRQTERRDCILLVDDEKENLASLSLVLERDYRLVLASDGREALEIIRNLDSPDDIQMIIADQRMPNLTGVALFAQAKDLVPDAVRIILTGFSDAEAIIASINDGQIYKFLMKPIDANDLRVTVKRSIEHYRVQRENIQLVIDLKKRVAEVENMVGSFEKFVPRQFLARVAREGIQNVTNFEIGKAERDTVTVMFVDVRSFTSMSEAMDPQDVLLFLNALYHRLGEPVHNNNGFVDKFIGDSIMALFDSPGGTDQEQAANAVRCAIQMNEALAVFNSERAMANLPNVKIGIGIHTGTVIIGTVGVQMRMDLTVLGDSVNIAARLEKLNKEYGTTIIVSENTRRLVAGDPSIRWRELDILRVKGREEQLRIYTVEV